MVCVIDEICPTYNEHKEPGILTHEVHSLCLSCTLHEVLQCYKQFNACDIWTITFILTLILIRVPSNITYEVIYFRAFTCVGHMGHVQNVYIESKYFKIGVSYVFVKHYKIMSGYEIWHMVIIVMSFCLSSVILIIVYADVTLVASSIFLL